MMPALDRVWRGEGARVVATLARRLGRLDVAEDAAQDAVSMAMVRWPRDGTPANPGAWLMTTAWRRALDLIRNETRRRSVPLDEVPADPVWDADATGEAQDPELFDPALQLADLRRDDDLLALLLACCHPGLAPDARIALTLRHVAGLTPREIAAMFMVSEATLEKRLVRARKRIRDTGIRFAIPDSRTLMRRLPDVQLVVYLIFTEGYLSSGVGEPLRISLCEEALWLARQLHTQLPNSSECRGLLALLLLQHSRVDARHDDTGELLPFAAQDRTQWNTAAVDEARALLACSTPDALGPYQVEAAIALLHATAADTELVPWDRIAELYRVLLGMTGSVIVAMNGAYALGRAGAAREAILRLDALAAEGALAKYAPLYAARADLFERIGERTQAHANWLEAATLTGNLRRRDQLRRRADRLLW